MSIRTGSNGEKNSFRQAPTKYYRDMVDMTMLRDKEASMRKIDKTQTERSRERRPKDSSTCTANLPRKVCIVVSFYSYKNRVPSYIIVLG